ncbi:MAG: ATP-binding protein [Sulfurimicrobium sp.]|nr:ATP-binding protein [Gallionella sp.]MDP1898305.1 ATP-binding protein [Sulfurimicrobium sp.]
MKQHFVETSNHRQFMAAVAAVENRGSPEACILLLTGEPGTGKSCTVDNWGASVDAIYLEGVPGMSLSFLRDYLADQTGVIGRKKFDQYKGTVEFFRANRQPIILDEAQHGLPNKAECIEYLRRIAETANTLLVLICHTSEKHRFSEHRLAHVATRVSAAPELKVASVDDCLAYLNALCEVGVDHSVAQLVHAQSSGRYRLMSNAGRTLEAIAGKKALQQVTATDIKGIRLCEDAMKSLKRGEK